MSGSQLTASVVPTGGAIMLNLPGYVSPTASGTITIARAVQSGGTLSAFGTLYSGPPLAVWIDAGDGTDGAPGPAPLSASLAYVYQVTDSGGAVQVGPLTPAPSLQPSNDGLTQLFIRLLQAGINNLTLPTGVQPVQVTTQMPVGGWQALPFIIVNLDLIQQDEVPIGQDMPQPDASNVWEITTYAKRVWRVTVLSRSAAERDFYRDSLLSIFQALKATVFAPLGLDNRHDFQAASGTDVNEWEGRSPGFYFADVLMTISGTMSVALLTGYGVIQSFAVTPTVTPDPTTITLAPYST